MDELMGEIGGTGAAPASLPAGGDHAAMAQAVIGMLGAEGSGGIAGLASAFARGGLGHLTDSWIGGGPNQPASPAQIEQGLGAGVVAQLAQRAGVSPQMASTILAAVLPAVINKLTPQGQVPSQDALGGLLGSLIGGSGTAPSGGGLGGLLGGLLGRK